RGHYAPARTLIDEGVAVALGSNFNPHLSPALSMQAAIALACVQMEMTVAEAISAATINASHTLKAADRFGSLECGKSGDVLLLDAPDYRELGCQFGTNLVHTAIKRGKVIFSLRA